jgi:succinoglycan biosynthesis transport protein ExoP
MQLSDFFSFLSRHKLTLLIVPLITIVVTFFLVRNLPDTYNAEAQIATGLADQTQFNVNSGSQQESKINQAFSNLIEMMRLKKVLSQVSYQLIIHDLTSEKPFSTPSKELKKLKAGDLKRAVNIFTSLHQQHEFLDLANPEHKKLSEVLLSMKYDEVSLNKQLLIFRANNSDFITIRFQSNNAAFSAFATNTLAEEFIAYYNSIVRNNQNKAVSFLGRLSEQKLATLNEKINELKAYKIDNHVLNLNEQAKILYGQIAEFEARREQAERDIIAFQGALNGIDNKFDPKDRKYIESTLVRINQDIIRTKEQLQQLNELYIQHDFDETYKAQIDELQRKLTTQINQSADKYISNPLAAKQALITEKINLQIQFDIAKYSINSINMEVDRLNKKFDALVPHEAVVQSFESAIEIAGKEYLEILQKYNQSSLDAEFSVQLRVAQAAVAELPQPSKKMLLVILSGIISFAFCLFVLFVLFYFDNSIKKSQDLADQTNLPVLGNLGLLSGNMLDFSKIWNENDHQPESKRFKNQLRSARFEIDSSLGNNQIVAVTSISSKEGKTLFAVSLAYAYSMVNKKVALIDANFDNPAITTMLHPTIFLEDYFKDDGLYLGNSSSIMAIGNRGGDNSLFEVGTHAVITQKLAQLKNDFDIIIIECPALESMNKAKEWIVVADKVVGVYETYGNISEHKKVHVAYLRKLEQKFIGWILNKQKKEDLTDSNKISA